MHFSFVFCLFFYSYIYIYFFTARETRLVTTVYHSSDLSSPESEDKSKQTGNLHMRLLRLHEQVTRAAGEAATAHASERRIQPLLFFSRALIYRQGSSRHTELLGTSPLAFSSLCLPNTAPAASSACVKSLQRRSSQPFKVEAAPSASTKCIFYTQTEL